MPLKVTIVEDDASFQASFVAAVDAAGDMLLHGVAQNVAQAMRLLDGPPADILVVDLGLPDGSGIEVIRAAHSAWPDCGIMVSTTFADDRHVIPSIEAGAAGYLLKDSSQSRMADDIRTLHSGGSPISPRIARKILQRMMPPGPPRPTEPAQPLLSPAQPLLSPAQPLLSPAQPLLSPREQQALELITKGFSYDEIAALMGVTRNTVMTFVRRIYQKLEVSSKAEAIFEARSHGLL